MAKVRIVQFPETRAAVLTHRGNIAALDETVRRFIAWRRDAGLTPERSATFTILHSSPAAGDFRHDLCAATDQPVAPNPAGVAEGVIPGARCAVVRLEGEDTLALGQTLEWLHRDWLPANGEAADQPPFARRLILGQAGSEAGMVTDLYLPLR